MAPGNVFDATGVGEHFGKECIASECVSFGVLAGIDVGLAGVARGVDEKSGFILAQIIEQKVEAGIIELPAREGGEVLIAHAQGAGKSFADVTRGAEEENHARRLASARTFSR